MEKTAKAVVPCDAEIREALLSRIAEDYPEVDVVWADSGQTSVTGTVEGMENFAVERDIANMRASALVSHIQATR